MVTNNPRILLQSLKMDTFQATQPNNPNFQKVIETFGVALGAYIEKANDLIMNPPSGASYSDKEQLELYQKVYSKVKEHLLLLWDLARPDLPEIFDSSAQSTPSPLEATFFSVMESQPGVESIAINHSLLQWIVRVIARRLGSPNLHIQGAQYFKIVHLNYVNGIAVIGVPVDLLIFPSWDLSILWHEVAGYEAARKRAHFEDWVEELDAEFRNSHTQSLWEMLRPLFARSYISNTLVYIKPSESNDALGDWRCDTTPVDPSTEYSFLDTSTDIAASIARQIASNEWRATWLREFFEDMFSVQVLRWATIEAFIEAVIPNTKSYCVGDINHPPLDLRVEVSLAYLALLQEVDHTPKESDIPVAKFREELNERFPDLLPPRIGSASEETQLQTVAQAIARFYAYKVETSQFSLPESKRIIDGADQEAAIADLILKARAQFRSGFDKLGFEGLRLAFSGELQKLQDGQNTDTEPPEENIAAFVETLKVKSIEQFLELEFATIDYNLDPNGATGVPTQGMIVHP